MQHVKPWCCLNKALTQGPSVSRGHKITKSCRTQLMLNCKAANSPAAQGLSFISCMFLIPFHMDCRGFSHGLSKKTNWGHWHVLHLKHCDQTPTSLLANSDLVSGLSAWLSPGFLLLSTTSHQASSPSLQSSSLPFSSQAHIVFLYHVLLLINFSLFASLCLTLGFTTDVT